MRFENGVSPIWLRQVATALSRRYSVQLKEGKEWSMNIEKQVMTYPAKHLLALDRDTCLGLILHELGHLHFTTSDWTDNSILFKKYPKITHNAVNAFEDVRINEKMSQSYKGSRDLIEAMNELLGGEMIKRLLVMNHEIKSKSNPRTSFDMPEWFEVFYISMLKLLDEDFFALPEHEYYDVTKMKIINSIVYEAKKHDLKNMGSTLEVYEFIEGIVFPKIEQYLPNPLPPNISNGQGQGQGQSASKENCQSEGQGQSDGNESGGDEPKKDEPKKEEGNNQGQSGGDEPKKDEPKKAPEVGKRGGVGVGGDEWKREIIEKVKSAIKRGRINPDKLHRTKPFNDNGYMLETPTVSAICNVEKHLENSKVLSRVFRNKFEAVFRDNQYSREQANQRSGRINKRALYKFPLGNVKLFKRKIDLGKKSYAVGFALDLSGSMRQEQVVGSFHALLAFTQTLEVMKISHAVGFFSNRTTIGKEFDGKMVARHMSLKASEVSNGGTCIKPLLKELFGKKLIEQKVKEKIAIILTDGLWDYQDYEQLRQLKKDNPMLHIYVVPLMLHHTVLQSLKDKVEGVATVLPAESPEEIVVKYIAIAKKHLISSV